MFTAAAISKPVFHPAPVVIRLPARAMAPAGYPALGGQHADYIESQLLKYRSGERASGANAKIMQGVAERLSNKEIKAVGQLYFRTQLIWSIEVMRGTTSGYRDLVERRDF